VGKQLNLQEIEKISKALGDPYRLQILQMVKKQKDWMQCVMITETIDLAQSTISHHVKQLVDAGILLADKDGRNLKFMINKEVMTAYAQFLDQYNH
jgi:ArsR family transcriptional regulator